MDSLGWLNNAVGTSYTEAPFVAEATDSHNFPSIHAIKNLDCDILVGTFNLGEPDSCDLILLWLFQDNGKCSFQVCYG